MRATRTRAVRGSAFAQSSSGAHLIEAARACRVDRGAAWAPNRLGER